MQTSWKIVKGENVTKRNRWPTEGRCSFGESSVRVRTGDGMENEIPSAYVGRFIALAVSRRKSFSVS